MYKNDTLMEEKKTTREVVMMNQVKTVCIFLKLKISGFITLKSSYIT